MQIEWQTVNDVRGHFPYFSRMANSMDPPVCPVLRIIMLFVWIIHCFSTFSGWSVFYSPSRLCKSLGTQPIKKDGQKWRISRRKNFAVCNKLRFHM